MYTMIPDGSGAIPPIAIYAQALGLAIPRMLGMFLVLPLLSQQVLPAMLRTCVLAVFCLPLLPSAMLKVEPLASAPFQLAFFLLKELGVGLFLGVLLAPAFWAFEAAGIFIDNQRGASIAMILDPMNGSESMPLGTFMGQAFLASFLVSGGLILLIDLIYHSYEVWPAEEVLPVLHEGTPIALLNALDRAMRVGILLAAPVLTAMLIVELAMGVISFFIPQFQVFFLAIPVKSALAFLILPVYAQLLEVHMDNELQYLSGAFQLFFQFR